MSALRCRDFRLVLEATFIRANKVQYLCLGSRAVDLPRTPPLAVKRQLRREAGFGCVVDGNPIFQYQHIVPWAVETHHRPEDMTVLCLECHDKATKGILSIEAQREYKANPYNLRHQSVSGRLQFPKMSPAFQIGGSTYSDCDTILEIRGSPVVQVVLSEDGTLLVSLDLRDSNDTRLVKIVENEWIAGTRENWDVEYGWDRLTMRHRLGGVFLNLRRKGDQLHFEGDLWRFGINVQMRPGETKLSHGVVLKGAHVSGAKVALSVGEPSRVATIRGELRRRRQSTG